MCNVVSQNNGHPWVEGVATRRKYKVFGRVLLGVINDLFLNLGVSYNNVFNHSSNYLVICALFYRGVTL